MHEEGKASKTYDGLHAKHTLGIKLELKEVERRIDDRHDRQDQRLKAHSKEDVHESALHVGLDFLQLGVDNELRQTRAEVRMCRSQWRMREGRLSDDNRGACVRARARAH
eukprot:4747641-Pleurochrysis_carterae.AAC.1